jgi:pilus assembly protein CpaB
MATRFGARSSFDTYILKVRWLVGAMASLIIVLGGALSYLALTTDARAGIVSELPDSPTLTRSATAYQDVVVARVRLETGQALNREHFSFQPFPADAVPINAVKAEALDSVSGKYAKDLIRVGFPLTYDDISESIPLSKLVIPDGYRAVSITADQRELVEGFVTPLSRVDVLWSYVDRNGRRSVKPLVRFAKVLSVNGDHHSKERSTVSRQGTTATLLVTAREAQLVELARGLGSLSLVLLGSGDNGEYSKESPGVDERMLYGEDNVPDEQPEYSGKAYVQDPRTGRVLRYVLSDRWELDTQF